MKYTPAEAALLARNDELSALIARQPSLRHTRERKYFETLANSIISQQISVKAAAKIFARFKETTNLQPEKAIGLSLGAQKSIGLSAQKAGYIESLAQHFVDDAAVFDHLEKLPDELVIAELTKVKGVGTWTAHMFLMFTLGRPDVFAPGDRGLQLALAKLLRLTEVPSPAECESIASAWQPYRTTAACHLWHSLENTPKSAT